MVAEDNQWKPPGDDDEDDEEVDETVGSLNASCWITCYG